MRLAVTILLLLCGCATRHDLWRTPSADLQARAQAAADRAQACVEGVVGQPVAVPPVQVLLRRCDALQDGLWVWRAGSYTFAATCNDEVILIGCSMDGREINDCWDHEALHWVLRRGLGIAWHNPRFSTCAGAWKETR